MSELTLTLKCFGAFRTHIKKPSFELKVTSGQSVLEVKQALKQYFLVQGYPKTVQSLVDDSALASNESVCLDDELINENGEYALLPPVCGG